MELNRRQPFAIAMKTVLMGWIAIAIAFPGLAKSDGWRPLFDDTLRRPPKSTWTICSTTRLCGRSALFPASSPIPGHLTQRPVFVNLRAHSIWIGLLRLPERQGKKGKKNA